MSAAKQTAKGKSKGPDKKRVIKVLRGSIKGIKKPQLARLVARSAVPEVTRMGGELPQALRKILWNLLQTVIGGSIAIAEHLRVKTVKGVHVQLWLALHGVYDTNAFKKGKKTGETFRFTMKRPNAKIKEIKTSLGTSILDRLPFQRLSREIAQSFVDRIRFSKNAFEELQFYAEAELGELIRAGSLIARSAERVTLGPRDLETAAAISHSLRKTATSSGPSHIKLKSYAYKVLKQIHPDTGTSSLAMQSVQQLTNAVFSKLMVVTNAMLRTMGAATLNSRTVLAAARIVFPGELATRAVGEGTKAVTFFNVSREGIDASQTAGTVRQSLSASARLTFPVARIITAARAFSFAKRISRTAGVFLAAVLEYITAEIFDLAGNQARAWKKVRIATKHVLQGINNDAELSLLFHDVLLGTALVGDAHTTPLLVKKAE